MSLKTEIELKNFFIFNSLCGPREGEELQKILYYHPITDNIDVQIKNVGLVEGIIQFTNTFKPSSAVQSLHTQKRRQLYFQPEKNFWVVLTLNLATSIKNKDASNVVEYLEDDLQDNVYEAVLQEAYEMYRLFWGTFESTVETHNIGTLKTRLEQFYKVYLKSLKLAYSDILNLFCGIQYLPLDKLTFLKVQCFINALECKYSEVELTAFLYNDHLIWSGLEPNDMKIVYQYLVGTLLPVNMESELQGGSMPRNLSSPFASLHHGRFITVMCFADSYRCETSLYIKDLLISGYFESLFVGPANLKGAKTIGKVPKIHLQGSESKGLYHLIVYRALSASVCFFIKETKELTLPFFKALDEFLSPKLTAIVSDISEYCTKQVITPSNIPENSPRFIYFNRLNLAYKSTVHLDNKQTGNIACTKEALKIMTDLNSNKSFLGHSSEIIVKTMNDYWVVAKNSNFREFYVALQQKNASLIDISGKD